MSKPLCRVVTASLPVLSLSMVALSLAGCSREITPAVVAGVDACAHCNMVIDDVNQAAGWIQDGEFVPFDSPGCLLARYEALRDRPPFRDLALLLTRRVGGPTFFLLGPAR